MSVKMEDDHDEHTLSVTPNHLGRFVHVALLQSIWSADNNSRMNQHIKDTPNISNIS